MTGKQNMHVLIESSDVPTHFDENRNYVNAADLGILFWNRASLVARIEGCYRITVHCGWFTITTRLQMHCDRIALDFHSFTGAPEVINIGDEFTFVTFHSSGSETE